MKIIELIFPTPLEEIKDRENDNVDFFVKLEDGYIYTLVAITPLNILEIMKKNKLCFFEPGPPMIIVKEITEEHIYSAIEMFSENQAYWLKEYYLSGNLDIEMLDDILSKLNKQ